MKSNLQCYRCQSLETNTEHVPPKCFFPKQKDMPKGSPDYRKNLLTVPACQEHNNARSQDDEYTAAVIAMNAGSALALKIFKYKWARTLLRNNEALKKRFLATARDVKVITNRQGLLIPEDTLVISYEIDRINRVISSVAHAIYHIESGMKKIWTHECTIRSPRLTYEDLSIPQDLSALRQTENAFIQGELHPELGLGRKGENPDIFYYQFFDAQQGNFVIRMVFYQSFSFLAFLQRKESTFRPVLLQT